MENILVTQDHDFHFIAIWRSNNETKMKLLNFGCFEYAPSIIILGSDRRWVETEFSFDCHASCVSLCLFYLPEMNFPVVRPLYKGVRIISKTFIQTLGLVRSSHENNSRFRNVTAIAFFCANGNLNLFCNRFKIAHSLFRFIYFCCR